MSGSAPPPAPALTAALAPALTPAMVMPRSALRAGGADGRPPHRLRRRLRCRLGGQRGAVSMELAIVLPVVLLLVMTLIQAAVWFYARSIALGAAQEGARAGRLQPASTGRAQAAAERFLDQTAQDLLTGRSVAVSGTPQSIEVTVTGTALSLLPGRSVWSVSQTAVGPVERPTP